MKCTPRFAAAILGAILAFFASPASAAPVNSPLWASLQPGPYAVGFKHIYVFDPSRTWIRTRASSGPFTPDRKGRPIRISIWFPAAPGSGTPMQFGDYLSDDAPTDFKDYNALVRAHDLFHSRLNVPDGTLTKFLATPVNALKDARAPSRSFPLVIYCDGLDGDTVSNVVLAEYLASHGFIVATVPIMGRDQSSPTQKRDQPGMETTIRDLEFTWGTLRTTPEVDGTLLALMGHSLGAVEAILFAMRNADVSAVVGLDGTYGFSDATEVLTGFYGYDRMRMASPLLDLRRAEKSTGPSAFKMDLGAVESFHYAPRTFITLTGMYHTDFTDFGILAKLFGFAPFADRNYDIGALGYQSVCRIVADYLANTVAHERGAGARLSQDVAGAPGGKLRYEAAVSLPPTPEEMVTLAATKGLGAAKEIVQRYKSDAPGDVIVNEAEYDALGYALLQKHQNKEAILALAIDTYVYPRSANLADSLGDMYAGAGNAVQAAKAYRHGLELLPNDPEQNSQGKRDMEATLRQALQKLTGGPK